MDNPFGDPGHFGDFRECSAFAAERLEDFQPAFFAQTADRPVHKRGKFFVCNGNSGRIVANRKGPEAIYNIGWLKMKLRD
ncbi:hypothetical protein D3C74_456420 [compost metagenome]